MGVSDEEVAHLRLLMRQAAPQLAVRWRWGAETAADLILIDTGTLAGQMARTRALSTGVRCAALGSGDDMPDTDTLLLSRPFNVAAVASVLEQVDKQGDGTPHIERPGQGFYFDSDHDFDSGHDHAASPDASVATGMPLDANHAQAAPGLEEWMRDDLQAAQEPATHLPGFDTESTTYAAGDGGGTRAEVRDRHVPGPPPGSADSSPPSRRVAVDNSRQPMPVWLTSELLGGPAQIQWVGAGVLSVDPKHQVFHSGSGLATLEPYMHTAPRRSDWRSLTSTDLALVREQQPAQPYALLLWLHALLHADGQLASHLDPGGSYQIKGWMEIRRDYPQQSRIAASMMQPMRLHEIAAASEAPMSAVFAVVNAFDAIGRLSWTPRPSRHGDAAPPAKGGILWRLRNPFGRN